MTVDRRTKLAELAGRMGRPEAVAPAPVPEAKVGKTKRTRNAHTLYLSDALIQRMAGAHREAGFKLGRDLDKADLYEALISYGLENLDAVLEQLKRGR